MDNKFENSEYPFYFIEAPVPLQRLTTTTIAINLLQHANFGDVNPIITHEQIGMSLVLNAKMFSQFHASLKT